MNNIFYASFSLTARFLGYGSAIASMALHSGAATFGFIYGVSVGVRLENLNSLLMTVSLCAIATTLMHGSWFGSWSILGIPAISSDLRFLNYCVVTGQSPRLREGLSISELTRLVTILVKLPRMNGQIGAVMALFITIPCFTIMLLKGAPLFQLSLVGVVALMALLLHGSITSILSELAVSRIVASCRQAILANIPDFKMPATSSMNGKFLILGQAFITALVCLFAITYFAQGSLGAILVILIYSVVLMTTLGYLVLYRIGTSLNEIREAATNLREGRNELTYSKALDSEFVDIADGLNSATLAIQDHQQNLEDRILKRTKELSLERDKSEKLLLNILPTTIAEELKQTGTARPVKFESVTVIFTDFVGFTRIAENLTPEGLIDELDKCFSYFDSVTEKYNLEKLKTIGDAYMCAGGIPNLNRTHALDAALAALEIQAFMNQMKALKEHLGYPYWELRLGMHCGELIAGVIGEKKFAYDVWGDTVNTASRLESSGTPGEINISAAVYEQVKFFFKCEYRGKVKAKNKGEIDMYYLRGLKRAFSTNGECRVPNDNFREAYQKIANGARARFKKDSEKSVP